MELFLSGSTPLDDLCVGHPFSLDRVFSVFMLFLENAKGENTEIFFSILRKGIHSSVMVKA
jgi:hypothetical protein